MSISLDRIPLMVVSAYLLDANASNMYFMMAMWRFPSAFIALSAEKGHLSAESTYVD